MIGQSISHYRILEKLGQGGMGDVYLAEDTKLGRRVALKFLPPALWHEPNAQERLVREARAASRLDHPNIVTIYGIEESEGRPFIHMAHVQGVALDAYCAARPRTAVEVLDLAIQIADALRHAHDAGIVHRDLKPSNVLVDDGGRVRMLDFGIASLRGAARLTQTGMTLGTLAYAPPELAQGKTAEPSSDIYSFGVVLYQMLAGRLPFEADHDAALLYAILNNPPPPLSAHRSDVGADVQAIVTRCLEKEPPRRYAAGQELLEDLRRARGRLAAAGAPTPDDKPSIAVLPFANMSADPENEYFSDGLSEELLNVLARNPALKVTGRTSSFAFKGKQEDMRDIGQKLGVSTLLEGSVRKAGNRVRITAQLVKVSDGFHLWSETYDRVLDDIFAVQDDIARAVSTAMNVTLLGASRDVSTRDGDAYALLLQANQVAQHIDRESLERAVSLYRRVIEKTPDDARAWAGLALVYALQTGYGFANTRDGMRAARTAADKALALDDSLAQSHTNNGWLLAMEHRWDECGAAMRRAYALAPGDGRVLGGLASYEGIHGHHDEAMRLMRQAVELDPLSATTHQLRGRAQIWARDYEGALASFARAIDLSPTINSARAGRALALTLLGRMGEALAEAEREPAAGYRNCAMAIVRHALGDHAASDAAVASLAAEGDEWSFQLAMAYGFRGDADLAFEWLERALAIGDTGLAGLMVTPAFNALHDDPRWRAFVEQVGFKI